MAPYLYYCSSRSGYGREIVCYYWNDALLLFIIGGGPLNYRPLIQQSSPARLPYYSIIGCVPYLYIRRTQFRMVTVD
jgi:hypothetical protein